MKVYFFALVLAIACLSTVNGKDCKTDCEGLGNNCSLKKDESGCGSCYCEQSCPDIFCGMQCRRMIRKGACPYCDSRRGKQYYIKGVKPSPKSESLHPFAGKKFDIRKKE